LKSRRIRALVSTYGGSVTKKNKGDIKTVELVPGIIRPCLEVSL